MRRLEAGPEGTACGSRGAGGGPAAPGWREEKEKWGLETWGGSVQRRRVGALLLPLRSLLCPGKPRGETRTGGRTLALRVGAAGAGARGGSRSGSTPARLCVVLMFSTRLLHRCQPRTCGPVTAKAHMLPAIKWVFTKNV